MYFNSRPCGRGDVTKAPRRYFFFISIHAPAGGATRGTQSGGDSPIISIHAPAGGATRFLFSCEKRKHYFNSRPCGRGDGNDKRIITNYEIFQFTPLREGRQTRLRVL